MYNLKQIPSQTKINKFIRTVVYGKHIFCPRCKNRNIVRSNTRYYCKKCRRRFSLLSHTWLSNMKLPLQIWWLILWCWTTQIPVKQTMALSNVSEKGVRHWFDQFRIHLPADQKILKAVVQLDEAYFGYFKKKTLIMAKQTGTRKLAYHILDTDPARYHAVSFLKRHIQPKSTLHTDGSSIYTGIDKWYPILHKKEIHKQWEFMLTSEIEGVFGNLRTFIRRMYHHVTVKKLPEIVCEFCYRFSHPKLFKNPRYYLTNCLSLVPTG